MCRAVDLTSSVAASLAYYRKQSGLAASDHMYFEVSTTSCASGFGAALVDHTTANTGTSYGSSTVDLAAYVGQTAYLRWRGGMPTGNTA
jgi:hypothetical protein